MPRGLLKLENRTLHEFANLYFGIRITWGHFDTQLTSLLVVNTSEFDERTSLSRILFDNLFQ